MINYEIKFEKKVIIDKKKHDVNVMENKFYELRNIIIERNNYISLLKDNTLTYKRLIKKIDTLTYEAYQVIEDIIENGCDAQTNKMAINFLNSDKEKLSKQLRGVYKIPRSFRSCYHNNLQDKYYRCNDMIKKLKYDACL